MNDVAQLRHVYCLGLGGIGVSAVAKLLLARGVTVSGYDRAETPILQDVIKRGATFFSQPDPGNIAPDVELIVASDDYPLDHPARLEAARRGIPCENFSVTLGKLMSEKKQRLTIAGTNGKSTTTALAGLILRDAGYQPTVFVGSRVTEFDGNVLIGDGDIFVAEADEYRDHFLNYRPTIGVLTNIEPDHLDYFGTSERMVQSFTAYTAMIPNTGLLVANADDPQVMSIAAKHERAVTFGISQQANLRAIEIIPAPGQLSWTAIWKGTRLGRMTLHLPGTFNIMNALAAMAGSLAAGADPKTFADSLNSFRGIWRRFQVLTSSAQRTVVSDYAHHPTAVRATLEGARAFYPGRRIVAVFQPHHQSRLTALYKDFLTSFSSADITFIVETYTVPGREVHETAVKTGRQLATAVGAQYAPSPTEALAAVRNIVQSGDVVIFMGAGDIWRAAESLANNHE